MKRSKSLSVADLISPSSKILVPFVAMPLPCGCDNNYACAKQGKGSQTYWRNSCNYAYQRATQQINGYFHIVVLYI